MVKNAISIVATSYDSDDYSAHHRCDMTKQMHHHHHHDDHFRRHRPDRCSFLRRSFESLTKLGVAASPKQKLSATTSLSGGCKHETTKKHSADSSSSSCTVMHNSSNSSSGTLQRRATRKNRNELNLLVVGGKGVGKSALTVRYITNRYIGEYISGEDTAYTIANKPATELQRKAAPVHILDTSSDDGGDDANDANERWADGVVVVYDVGDRASFEFARRAVDRLQGKPALLIGNKNDMPERRRVQPDEAERLCQRLELARFCELSAAEGGADVRRAVDEFIGAVRSAPHRRRAKHHSPMAGENLRRFLDAAFFGAKKHTRFSSF